MKTASAVFAVVMLACSSRSEPSTPKAAALAYLEACQRGDTNAAVALSTARSQDTRTAVEMLAVTYGSMAQVDRAIRERFGASGPVAVLELMSNNRARLADAVVEEDGDRAILRVAGEPPMHVRRVEGKWRVEVEEGSFSRTKDEVVRFLDGSRSAAEEVVKNLKAGQYGSATEAWREYEHLSSGKPGAAVRPTSGEAGAWPEAKKAEFYGYCQGKVGASTPVPECDCLVRKMQQRFKWVERKQDFDNMDPAALVAILDECRVGDAARRVRASAR